jgi:hypothetical protein
MTTTRRAGLVVTVFVVALVVSFAALAIYSLQPPAAAPSSAPPSDFSSARAMRHVRAVAAEAHPVGSAAHAKVREYILGELSALGLEPVVQDAHGVRNIVVRLEGEEKGKAVLLVGHYDTVPGSPGAGDDTSAVAVMLETLRALRQQGASLRNGVICLFSDAEEIGLKGAEAFVYAHPWAGDVGLVLNFDARGNSGPALMFETSDGNEWVVEQFARGATHARATSLSYDLYKLLPNDTDFTVFKEAGMAGLNFALVKGPGYYHSPLDTAENLSPRSLQHQGTYALELTRHFGNLELGSRRSGDAVYFNVLGSPLLSYSRKWVMPSALLLALACVVVLAWGRREGRLTFSGMAKGVAAVTLNAAVVLLTLWLARLLFDASGGLGAGGVGGGGDVQALLLVVVAAGAAAAFHVWFSRKSRAGAADMLAGGLLCWLALMLLTSLFLPGGSYLFTWPLLSGLLALAYLSAVKSEGGATVARSAFLSASAIPAVVLFAPVVYLSLLTFTPASALSLVLITLPVVLVLPLLAPQLESSRHASRRSL